MLPTNRSTSSRKASEIKCFRAPVTLAPGGGRVQRRVNTANPRRIAATETEVFYVSLQLRVRIGLPVRLVISTAIMLIMSAGMMVVLDAMARSECASVLR